MLYEISNAARDITLSEADHALIDENLRRHLDPLLASLPEDAAPLRILINDESGRPFVDVTLRLALPDRLLRAHETGPAFRPAFERALRELRRQVLEWKDRHGRDHSRGGRRASAS
jgi:ribosome-associated translation inhibitor RaiA